MPPHSAFLLLHSLLLDSLLRSVRRYRAGAFRLQPDRVRDAADHIVIEPVHGDDLMGTERRLICSADHRVLTVQLAAEWRKCPLLDSFAQGRDQLDMIVGYMTDLMISS